MLGLPEVAPFEAIIVAAAGLKIPDALLEQLGIGAYVVAPIGTDRQVLQLTKRTGTNQWQSVILGECHFVPLREGVV
jgi:protein-L-isoaspartate(D-aspartate) O-methyltransferase